MPTITNKKDYLLDLQARVDQLEADLKQLDLQTRVAARDAKATLKDAVQAVVDRRDALFAKMKQVKDTSEAAWDEARTGLEAAWYELTEAVERARLELKKSS